MTDAGFTSFGKNGPGYAFSGERARILAKRLAYIEKHGSRFLFDNSPPPAPGWPAMTPRPEKGHSRKRVPDKLAQQKAVIAEIVANGGFVKDAAPVLGIRKSRCGAIWREIVAEMGWQAA